MEKKPAAACTLEAPCKINLHLAIGERRPDGFHELESLFAPLAFHDTLRFERGGKDGNCSLEMNWEAPPGSMTPVIPPGIPFEKNLVWKAVSLFREKTGFKSGLFIRLDKRVPVGAGLGGGSSDAASCLLALNSLVGDALPMDELRELAAILGSDVPFFLNGGAAFVGGRGELVEPVKTPRGLWVLLAKPGFSSDTAGAFQLLDQTRERDRFNLSLQGKMTLLTREKLSKNVLIKALERAPETWPFYNDFLPVFLTSRNPQDLTTSPNGTFGAFHGVKKTDQYQTILANLKKAGALFAGLSGAGSCCFGIFRAKETAENAEKELEIPGIFLKLTFFLAQKTIPVLEY